jgi:hypothetical protein
MSASGEQDSRVKGLTDAGLAYQKHMGRGELPLVPGSELNSAGQFLLDGILTDPATKWAAAGSKMLAGGEYGILPNGVGAAFDAQGMLQYFGRFRY